MIKINYNPEDNIFYYTKEGVITIHDFIEVFTLKMTRYKDVKEFYNLYDLRGNNARIDITEFKTLIKNISQELNHIETLKTAVIVDSSTDTAISFLYEEMAFMYPKYEFKTFSTVKGAKQWLKFAT